MHVKANYVLFLENLMDLTHLPFVHKTTIGGHASDHTAAEMATSDTATGERSTPSPNTPRLKLRRRLRLCPSASPSRLTI